MWSPLGWLLTLSALCLLQRFVNGWLAEERTPEEYAFYK
jgi:hypothetical protein